MTRANFALAVLLLAGGAASPVAAQATRGPSDATSLPAWDQLTRAQRDLLIAPMRERWNDHPADRPRMLAHARRWQEMTPEQRQRARRGMHRWEKMDPDHRRRMRVLFEEMRDMTPEQRKALRDKWHAMTHAQRRAWIERNAAGKSD
jgi:hypothetical protein